MTDNNGSDDPQAETPASADAAEQETLELDGGAIAAVSAIENDDEHTRKTVRIQPEELAGLMAEDRPAMADDDGLLMAKPPVRKADVDESMEDPTLLAKPPVRKGDVDEDADPTLLAKPPVRKGDIDEGGDTTATAAPSSYSDDDEDDDDDPFGADIDAMDDDVTSESKDASAPKEPAAPEHPPEIALDLIDKDAVWVVRRLRAKGYDAYLTGGCVRDLLLGRDPKDFDVATAATPNQCRSVFRNCRLVGRRFRLAHVYFPGNKVIETATFRANPLDVVEEEDLPEDLLLERDNVFGSIEEDARRRDLTVNGLFYDPLEGKVIDYVDGRKDLDARLIRTIGDPQIRFQEDPVRIIRAVKFATRLDFDIEPDTLQAMKDQVGGLARCSPPRLQEEIVRLMTSGHAAQAMKMCAEIGVFDTLMGELNEALDIELAPAPYTPPELVAPVVIEPSTQDASAELSTPVEASETDAPSDATSLDSDAPADGSGDAAPEVTAPDAVSASTVSSSDENAEAPVEGELEGSASDNSSASVDVKGAAASTSDETTAPEAAPPAVVAEPPAPPPPPATPAERRERLAALMGALDEVKERGADISSAVAFSALLLPAWEAYSLSDQDAEQWLDRLTASWGERLRMTRRDKDSLIVLFNGLDQLRPENRHGSKARHLVGRPWFREAMLLFIASNRAQGNSLDEVGKWKAIAAHYKKPYAALRPGERESRPRRARRSRPSGNSGGGGGRRGRRGR